MLLGDLKRDKSIGDCFVLEGLRLGIEVVDASAVERMKDVLNGRDKLSCLCTHYCKELESFKVEWEVFDVLSQFNDTNDQLHQGMDQKHKIACTCISKSQYPQLHAIVELPTVDTFDSVFSLHKLTIICN